MAAFEGTIDIYIENTWNATSIDDAWKRGIRAVFHRASIGLQQNAHEKAVYLQRKTDSLTKGFLWGAYHFLTSEDIDGQLANFLSVEDASDPKTAMAIDFEQNKHGPTITIDGVRDFVQKFNLKMKTKGYPDRYPMLYGGNLIREALSDEPRDDLLAKCPLWYVCLNTPHNGVVNTVVPQHPWPAKTWNAYALWQYDDESRQYGSPPPEMIHPGEKAIDILPGADWNRFAGSADDLKNLWPFS